MRKSPMICHKRFQNKLGIIVSCRILFLFSLDPIWASSLCCCRLQFEVSPAAMLAYWFRLKHPELVQGALASSAPIRYFDNLTPQDGYHSIVTQDFREASESCYRTIKDSWSEIDMLASQPDGLATLSQIFNSCDPLQNSATLKIFLVHLYARAAQYDAPPAYPVNIICNHIDNAPEGASVIDRIRFGIDAILGNQECRSMVYTDGTYVPSPTYGMDWQKCTELVMPIGTGNNDTMFESIPFDMTTYISNCQRVFGVTPRPHWITTEYGGNHIKALQKFGSNIIFSNGLRDPFSSAGVLEDLSESIVAIHAEGGSHCLDLHASRPDDPHWLVSMRKKETEYIYRWIAQYNAATKKFIIFPYVYVLVFLVYVDIVL